MGTKYCPEAPRQKMISVMYLVLTAMLALNVDKSVLDAFVMVDHSFMQTIENFTSKNQRVYSDFAAAAKENEKKAGALNETVLKVKASSDSLYNYILSLKELIVKTADGPKGNINEIVSQQDLHVTALVMLTQKKGAVLKKAIDSYRNSLLSLIDTSNTELITSIKHTLDTSAPPPKLTLHHSNLTSYRLRLFPNLTLYLWAGLMKRRLFCLPLIRLSLLKLL